MSRKKMVSQLSTWRRWTAIGKWRKPLFAWYVTAEYRIETQGWGQCGPEVVQSLKQYSPDV